MTSQDINNIIDHGNFTVISSIFNSILADKKDIDNDMRQYWDEYQTAVDIRLRARPVNIPDWKANNKIPNDYRGMIIDQGVTYTFGVPIKVSIRNSKPEDEINKRINEFRMRNNTDDLDLETAIYTGVCGSAARLMYIDEEGFERCMNIKPWESAFIYDKTTNELQYGMIYYDVEYINAAKNQKKKLKRIEWYDNADVYYYRESPAKEGYFELDKDEPKNPQPHGYADVPMVEYLNNDARTGDFENVREEIDAYDRLISDCQNELEDFRNAYMVVKGMEIDDKVIQKARSTGALGSSETGFDVTFAVKDLNGTFHENQKKTLNENIYKFSKRVDFQSDKIQTGAVSGIALLRMLQTLENDAIMKERKFTSATRKMYQLLQGVFAKKRIQFNYLDVELKYTRNIPIDYQYYGQVVTLLFGKIPLKVLYSLLPFIEDPNATAEEYNAERNSGVDLNNLPQFLQQGATQ